MELQHINVKLFAEGADQINHEELNAVFQTWIQKKLRPELLIDVADYLHVPAGPGMILVGLEADYSFDHTHSRWGLRYNRKASLNGSNEDRLKQATLSALEACQLLETDDRLLKKIKFRCDEIEMFINDRALVPNNLESKRACQSDLENFFKKLLGDHDLQFTEDPRQRFGLIAKSSKSNSLSQLIENLSD